MRANSSAIDFVRDEDELEEIDHLFEQLPDEVFAAIVDSASSDKRRAKPYPPPPPLVVNSSAQIAATCCN